MVLTPQRDGPDRAFDRIVVELDTAVVQEMTEGRPAGKGVTDSLGEATAARNATKLRLEPRLIASTSGRDLVLRTLWRSSAVRPRIDFSIA